MKNTFESCFNVYESTYFTPSLACASSGSMKYHSWAAVDRSKVRDVLDWKSPIAIPSAKFSWVGWLL
jgi:hypothetical protein